MHDAGNDPVAFDPYSQATLDDPFTGYGTLLDGTVARYGREGQEFLAIGRYEDVRGVLRDVHTWTSRFGPGPKDLHPIDGGLNSDPPKHSEWRRIYGAWFTPKALERLAPYIEQAADRLIDAMLLAGRGDLHDDFAMPLVTQVMATVVGLPPEDYRLYKRCADDVLVQTMNNLEMGATKDIIAEVFALLRAGLAEREAILADAGITDPGPELVGTVLPDDLLSVLLCARFEGRPMTKTEMLTSCVSFFTGGAETTSSWILMCMRRLLEVPSRWEQLKREPERIDLVLEESLRFDPPALALFRKSACPVDLHGERLPEGTRLMFSIVSANRDPEAFTRPDEFLIEREPAEIRRHLAFGYGPHFCVGAGLARVEARLALRTLVDRLPQVRLTGPIGRIAVWNYWGISSMPAAWD